MERSLRWIEIWNLIRRFGFNWVFVEFQVVHMTMNPADEAAENYKNETDKLRAEVCRLMLNKCVNQNFLYFVDQKYALHSI